MLLPIYNVEKYLSDCLDSLLDQDISKCEYEIICVNDGSTDNSLKILKKYEKENNNIKVIDTPNRGVSAARNTAIDMANGEYLWMVDPDDKVRSNCLCDLLESIVGQEALFFGYGIIFEDDNGLKNEKLQFSINKIYERKNMFPLNLSSEPGFYEKGCYVWGMIIKKEFLSKHNIRFNEKISFQEDVLFYIFVKAFLKNCLFFKEIIYYYRMRNTSVTHQRSTEWSIKNYNSIKELYRIVSREAENEIYSKEVTEDFLWEKKQCAESIIFLLLPLEDDFVRQELKNLKKEGIYPYRCRTENLKFWKCPSLKYAILTMSRFLLFKEWYFYFYRFIMKKLR